jgi:hypothetical protein
MKGDKDMAGEYEGRSYDGAVKVPDEIRNVRDPIMFGLTGRELICLVCGLMIAGSMSFLAFGLIHLHNKIFLVFPVALALPFFIVGFLKPGGLFFEDFLVIWCSNNLKSAPIRKLSAVNAYEKAQIIGIEKRHELELRKNGGKKKSKEKKSKSAYVIRL